MIRAESPNTMPTVETAGGSDISSGQGPSRRMNLRMSLSFKRPTGVKEKPSLFASFTQKANINKLPANSCHPTRMPSLPGAKEGKLKASHSNNSLDKLEDDHQAVSEQNQSNHINLGALGGAEMARLLEYDSQDEGTSDDFSINEEWYGPVEDTRADNQRSSGYSRSSTVSIDENSTEFEGGELDSVTLLNRLGDNPTEHDMAQVALSRAQESMRDCFSVGVDQENFDKIPSYIKDDLQLGKHLGKGSFSDVFEVTVVVNDGTQTRDNSDFDKILVEAAMKTNDSKGAQVNNPSAVTSNAYGRRRPSQRRHSMCSSVCVGSLGRPQVDVKHSGKRMTLAMKCLRPQARSNFEHFLVGVEDLIHETAILSSLNHPNIIKLWGRAGNNASLKLSDGYFILVDRLKDTLQDKIDRWAKTYPNAKKNPPSLNQIKVACDLSDAISYLHMSNVVFRDLKPVSCYCIIQLQIFELGPHHTPQCRITILGQCGF